MTVSATGLIETGAEMTARPGITVAATAVGTGICRGFHIADIDEVKIF